MPITSVTTARATVSVFGSKRDYMLEPQIRQRSTSPQVLTIEAAAMSAKLAPAHKPVVEAWQIDRINYVSGRFSRRLRFHIPRRENVIGC